MVRLISSLLLCVVFLPLSAFSQLPSAYPDVFSSLGVDQGNAQVRIQGTIGQVLIGLIASENTAAVQQGFWPQVRRVTWISTDAGDAFAPEIPADFGLQQNYPNPFNPTTTIPFALARQSQTELVIYNTLGQTIRSFDLSAYSPGHYELFWSGQNNSGLPVPSGIYFYRLTTAEESAVQRMLLLK